MRRVFITISLALGLILGIVYTYGYFKFKISYIDVKAKRLFKEGFFLYNRGYYLSAVSFFKKSIENKHNFHLARYFLAKSYYRAGFTEDSVEELKRIIELKPDNIPFYKSKLSIILNEELSEVLTQEDRGRKESLVFQKMLYGNTNGRFKLLGPYRIAITSDGFKYITGLKSGTIVVFDYNNKLYDYFYYIDGLLKKPTGIFTKDGIISFVDSEAGRLCIKKKEWKCTNENLIIPRDIVINNKNEIWVVDTGDNKIKKFTEQGELLFSFGGEGEDEYNFLHPISLAIDDNNDIYILDDEKKIIGVYDDYGSYIKSLSISEFEEPTNIKWIEKYKTIILIDSKSGIYKYDNNTKEWKEIKIPKKEDIGYFSDASIDEDGFLYVLDFASNGIATYSPERFIYSNLDLSITRVDWTNFPTIAAYITLKDRMGRYIDDFDLSNIEIYDEGVKAVDPNLIDIDKENNPLKLIILVDSSKRLCEKSEYSLLPSPKEDVKFAISKILDDLNEGDKIAIYSINSDLKKVLDFDGGKLRILKHIKEINCERSEEENKSFGKILYNALSLLLNTNKKRAILSIMTTKPQWNGEFSEEVVTNYAKINRIPLFFISFDRDMPSLKRLAKNTNGKFAYIYDLEKISKFAKYMKSYKRYEKLILFRSLGFPPNRSWHSIRLIVRYKGSTGLDISGYYVPLK